MSVLLYRTANSGVACDWATADISGMYPLCLSTHNPSFHFTGRVLIVKRLCIIQHVDKIAWETAVPTINTTLGACEGLDVVWIH